MGTMNAARPGDDCSAGARSNGVPVIGALARACHPGPSLAVTAFATAMAIGSGRRCGALPVAAAVLSGQLSVGWSNDYIDRDRDRRAGRTDKPIVAGAIGAETVRAAAAAAAVACVPLSLLSGWRAATVHGAAVTAAFGYNARLKGTAASVVPYLGAFGALPAFVTLGGSPRRWPSSSTVLAAALMGAGAHFVNTLPDLEADASTGIRGLPHRLGHQGSLVAGVSLLGVAAAAVARSGDEPLGRVGQVLCAAAASSVAGVVAAAATGRPRLAWRLALCTSGVTVALFLSRQRVR